MPSRACGRLPRVKRTGRGCVRCPDRPRLEIIGTEDVDCRTFVGSRSSDRGGASWSSAVGWRVRGGPVIRSPFGTVRNGPLTDSSINSGSSADTYIEL
ncbi:hypothetical protein NL676_036014 [Syzygium grande]|nr:hypothetical protein NL676_036014 [Syzygium grande]